MNSDGFKDGLRTYRIPVLATCTLMFTWYWLLLGRQSRLKRKLAAEYEAKGEVFDRYHGKDPRMLSIDRIVINTQEQMVPMLVSMWVHSFFVNPTVGGILGFCWIALRIAYSFVMPKELKYINPKKVFFTTLPQYLIILYLVSSTLVYAIIA